jgi:hypothetical protein
MNEPLGRSNPHSDALRVRTLGTASNSVAMIAHTHPEHDIIETKYFVVDAEGNGDYTTIQAACDSIGTQNGDWTIVVRNGTYSGFSPDTVYARISFVALGVVIITGAIFNWYSGNCYNGFTFHATVGNNNGADSYYHNCEFVVYDSVSVPGVAFKAASGFYLRDCYIHSDTQTVNPNTNIIGGDGVNNAAYYLDNCIIDANIGNVGAYGGHAIYLGTASVCEMRGGSITVTGHASARAIYNGAGTMAVTRVGYDTARTTGTITIRDGDVPAAVTLYGSMYADDIAQSVTIGSAGAYVKVPGSMTVGACNGFTLASSRELTCAVAGTYLAHWSMSLESTNNNEELAGAIMINTSEVDSTENMAECINGSKPVGVSGTGILTLAVNDVVALCVENETAAHNITVTHANLTLVRIGA